MDRRVARALRNSPHREQIKLLLLLSDVPLNRRRDIIRANLPSLRVLCDIVSEFMCVKDAKHGALNVAAAYLRKRNPVCAFTTQTRLVVGLTVVMRDVAIKTEAQCARFADRMLVEVQLLRTLSSTQLFQSPLPSPVHSVTSTTSIASTSSQTSTRKRRLNRELQFDDIPSYEQLERSFETLNNIPFDSISEMFRERISDPERLRLITMEDDLHRSVGDPEIDEDSIGILNPQDLQFQREFYMEIVESGGFGCADKESDVGFGFSGIDPLMPQSFFDLAVPLSDVETEASINQQLVKKTVIEERPNLKQPFLQDDRFTSVVAGYFSQEASQRLESFEARAHPWVTNDVVAHSSPHPTKTSLVTLDGSHPLRPSGPISPIPHVGSQEAGTQQNAKGTAFMIYTDGAAAHAPHKGHEQGTSNIEVGPPCARSHAQGLNILMGEADPEHPNFILPDRLPQEDLPDETPQRRPVARLDRHQWRKTWNETFTEGLNVPSNKIRVKAENWRGRVDDEEIYKKRKVLFNPSIFSTARNEDHPDEAHPNESDNNASNQLWEENWTDRFFRDDTASMENIEGRHLPRLDFELPPRFIYDRAPLVSDAVKMSHPNWNLQRVVDQPEAQTTSSAIPDQKMLPEDENTASIGPAQRTHSKEVVSYSSSVFDRKLSTVSGRTETMPSTGISGLLLPPVEEGESSAVQQPDAAPKEIAAATAPQADAAPEGVVAIEPRQTSVSDQIGTATAPQVNGEPQQNLVTNPIGTITTPQVNGEPQQYLVTNLIGTATAPRVNVSPGGIPAASVAPVVQNDDFQFVRPNLVPARPHRTCIKRINYQEGSDNDEGTPTRRRRRKARRDQVVANVIFPRAQEEEHGLALPEDVEFMGAEPIIYVEPQPVDVIPAEIEGIERPYSVWSNNATLKLLKNKMMEKNTRQLTFSQCCELGIESRNRAASLFSVLLTFEAHDLIQLTQPEGDMSPKTLVIVGLDAMFDN